MSTSFIARYEGTCAACFDLIFVGDNVRYNDDDELVHTRHLVKPRKPEVICQRCFLAKPCECDDD